MIGIWMIVGLIGNGKRLKISEFRKCIMSMVVKKIVMGVILECFFIESFFYFF